MPVESFTSLIAVTGPQGCGKSTLLAALLGAEEKAQSTANGVPHFEGLFGMRLLRDPVDKHLYLDCPGHPESIDETLAWASCADLSLVVIDNNPAELYRAAPLLAALAQAKKPHAIFINRIESEEGNLDATIASLQQMCPERLLVQQMPLHDASGRINGAVQLWNETAHIFKPEGGEKSVAIPPDEALEEALAREEFLESLSDFDDSLLASLLEDRLPTIRMLADDLREGVRNDELVPVFFGSASLGHGLAGLRDTLGHLLSRHTGRLLASIGESKNGAPLAVVLQNGEITRRGFAAAYRVLRGPISRGMVLSEQRLSSLFAESLAGPSCLEERDEVQTGEVMIALKVEPLHRGSLLGIDLADPELPGAKGIPLISLSESHYVQAVYPRGKAPSSGAWPIGRPESQRETHQIDDRELARLSQVLDRLSAENPCLMRTLAPRDPNTILLWSQGPAQHEALKQALETRFSIAAEFADPPVNYRERITSSFVKIHGRCKHQSGGHGAFGDVVLNVTPLEPGAGRQFQNNIVGCAIPKTYIPAIEEGLHDALERGQKGYPITDISVSLIDGQTHSVDSSEMAFRHAARLAIQALLEQTETELLEPYVRVTLDTPEPFDSQVMQQAAQLGGQIQEFSMTDRFPDAGWNTVTLVVPEARLPELIRQTRRLTRGLALFAVNALPPSEAYQPLMRH